VHGFAAETGAAAVITGAGFLGIPVSTTHAIGSAIMGVGATERLSAVRWGVAGQVVLAWIFTWPSCMVLGYFLEKAFANYEPTLVLGLIAAVLAVIGYLLLAKNRREIRENAERIALASA
jgi:uncharacterized membrane protein YfcA